MNTYFTIGELSKLSKVPRQTLIYYDKEGVFKPSRVDEHNGYRYYGADQMEVLDSIMILKEIGLSLQEIKDFMGNRDSRMAAALLRQQRERIEENIAELKMISSRLYRKIGTLEEYYETQESQVTYVEREEEYLAIEVVEKPQGLIEIDLALKRLLLRAWEKEYPYYYQIGDMVSVENLLQGNYTSFSYAFLPITKKIEKERTHKKPAGRYAHFYHKGAYEDIAKSYLILLADIKEKGLAPMGYSYEFCIRDSLTSVTSREYVTEIQLRVEEIKK